MLDVLISLLFLVSVLGLVGLGLDALYRLTKLKGEIVFEVPTRPFRRKVLALFLLACVLGAAIWSVTSSAPAQAGGPCNAGSVEDRHGVCVPVSDRDRDTNRDRTKEVAFVNPCTGLAQFIDIAHPRAFTNIYGANFYPFSQFGASYVLQPSIAQYAANYQFLMRPDGSVVPVGSDFLSGYNGLGLGFDNFALNNNLRFGSVPVVLDRSPSTCVAPTAVPAPVQLPPVIIQQAPAPAPASVAQAAPVTTFRLSPPNTGDAGCLVIVRCEE